MNRYSLIVESGKLSREGPEYVLFSPTSAEAGT